MEMDFFGKQLEKRIPLADFDCNTKDHRNYQLLDDYNTWFWNNR